MRRILLTTALAAVMTAAMIVPAGARPTSTYELQADLTGAAAGSVFVAFTEAEVTEVRVSRVCPGGGGEETWTSTFVAASTVSFDKRLSAVDVSATVSGTGFPCLGDTADQVTVSFTDGLRVDRTVRTRLDGTRVLTTPVSVSVQYPGISPQGVVGTFTQLISK